MSITPIGHPVFTKADLAVLMAHGGEMVEQGLAGACVPVETDDGELVVALLDHSYQGILCAFGKTQGWYYAFDSGWEPLAQGQMIDEVLAILPDALEGCRPEIANAH